MPEDHTPAVVPVPGINPNDGHEHFWSPRNIIAFALIAAFIAYSFMPYLKAEVPNGRAGDLIVSNGKVIETIVVLVIGFFFGTTVGAARREARTENTAAATTQAVLAAATRSPPLVVDPPAVLKIEEPSDADFPQADAARRAPEAAAPVGAPRGEPRRIGPPE